MAHASAAEGHGAASESQATPQPNMKSAVKLAVQTFLETKHFRHLHRILSKEWSGCHALSAATRLLEAHGVKVSKEDEERWAAWEANGQEDKMIEDLVLKMPQQSREQFEHFFLQLSFIASTTTRLRLSLESGRTELIEEALESADNVGVLPYLLKMAVAQAGQEVRSSEEEHDTWLGNTDARLGPLLQTSAEAVAIQKDLATARTLLQQFREDGREKTLDIIERMVDSSDQLFVETAMLAWYDHTKSARRERQLAAEAEEKLKAIHAKKVAFLTARAGNMKSVVNAHYRDNELILMGVAFAALEAEVLAKRTEVAARKKAEDIEERLKIFASAAASNARQYMARVCVSSDTGLLALAFQTWQSLLEDARKEKEMGGMLKETQRRLGEFVQRQKDAGKQVLTTMMLQSATAVTTAFFRAWRDYTKEQKVVVAKTKALEEKTAVVTKFVSRNKVSSLSAGERVAQMLEQQLVLYVFSFWKREAKVERMRRIGKEKNDKRKRELVGVKGLFSNFAKELETSLQSGTPRVELSKPRNQRGTPAVEG